MQVSQLTSHPGPAAMVSARAIGYDMVLTPPSTSVLHPTPGSDSADPGGSGWGGRVFSGADQLAQQESGG